jgi:xylose dehydrogenase (NAD/NADP)
MNDVRFAIMGTGHIAGKVAPRIAAGRGCRVTVAASRDPGRARAFADEHGIAGACTYDALLTRDDVDAVYLTLPNDAHPGWSIRLLEAGKHVLSEKPFAWRKRDAEAAFEVADRTSRVLVEAFAFVHTEWMERIRETLRLIGPIHRVEGAFEVELASGATDNVRFSRALAGGSMMDLGCYPMSFARVVTGEEPDYSTLTAGCELVDLFTGDRPAGDDRVDGSAWAKWRTPNGVEVDIRCSMVKQGTWGAVVTGEGGTLEVPEMGIPTGLRFTDASGRTTIQGRPGEREAADGATMYTAQAEGFARAVRGEATGRPGAIWSIRQAEALERVLAAMGLDLPDAPGMPADRA